MERRSGDLENSSELKFSREQGFFDKSAGVRWLIGLFFTLSLFLFLHIREERVEILDLGSVADSYIVAQVDFDFYDEEATIILKLEALRDVGKIYKFSDKEVNRRRVEFENYLIQNQDWRKYVPDSSYETMYKNLDLLVKALAQVRFTDPRTIHTVKRLGMPIQQYLIYTPAESEKDVLLPNQIWEGIRDLAFPDNVGENSAENLVLTYFQTKEWLIEEDIPAQRPIRRKIQANIPDKYTHVSAGSRIIDQGEKVTARHVAMLQAMKKALSEKRNLWHPLTVTGSAILALLLTVISWAFFRINHPLILRSNRKLFLLVTVVVLDLALSKFVEFFILNAQSNLIEVVRYPLVVPFAAILLCSLLNTSIAAFASGFLTVIMAMTLSFDRQGFMIMNLSAALVSVLSTTSLKRRKDIFIVCGKAWLCSIAVACSLHFYQNTLWNNEFLVDIISLGIAMLLTGILVVGLLPLLESGFKIMTDVTLMEYMDPNNDLLRRLSLEAPGTYQHSIVVGNLTEIAASAIGANGLFCRVSTLYHDIGKMITPQYFTENQQGGVNIHQLLTPQESAQVIIAHVAEGVALARKAGLPEQFIDIIKEHHGTTLCYYFYHKQVEKMGGDATLVDEREFRYGGPKPRSKESAIIMIADTLEAASRSLDKADEYSLTEMATRLIKEKADDGQFDECLLTFEELAIVRKTLVKTLVAYGHSRVKYPTKKPPKDSVPQYEA